MTCFPALAASSRAWSISFSAHWPRGVPSASKNSQPIKTPAADSRGRRTMKPAVEPAKDAIGNNQGIYRPLPTIRKLLASHNVIPTDRQSAAIGTAVRKSAAAPALEVTPAAEAALSHCSTIPFQHPHYFSI
jgi:hypothetical protein